MGYSTVDQLLKAISDETDRIWLQMPMEIELFSKGIFPSGAGSYGFTFPTMVFVSGDMRALATWITPNLMTKAAADPDYTLDQCKQMFAWINLINVDFLAYCGFVKLGEFAHSIIDLYDQIRTKDEFMEVLRRWYAYANRLYLWVHHVFPWSTGSAFVHRSEEELKEVIANTSPLKTEIEEYFNKRSARLKEWKTRR